MTEQREKSGVKIRFTIDGIPVAAEVGWTVLDTARHYHIPIPTLCYHAAVQPSGACRLCVVEVCGEKGSKVVISCMYTPFEGAQIDTQSECVLFFTNAIRANGIITSASRRSLRKWMAVLWSGASR